jgi:hypothetical protein
MRIRSSFSLTQTRAPIEPWKKDSTINHGSCGYWLLSADFVAIDGGRRRWLRYVSRIASLVRSRFFAARRAHKSRRCSALSRTISYVVSTSGTLIDSSHSVEETTEIDVDGANFELICQCLFIMSYNNLS